MNNMESKFKEMDLSKVKARIEKDNGAKKGPSRSLANAKNLTAKNKLEDIIPVGDRVLITLKSWAAQSVNGLFMPESYTVIRGDMYIAQVEKVGEEVTLVKEGDVLVVSIYSGHHITTKTGHAKIISESDILIYKNKKEMEKNSSFDPTTFKPGVNYILVEMINRKAGVTDSGIITEMGDDDAFNTNDVATKTATILAKGPVDQFGKEYKQVKEGKKIIVDAYVGIDMNTADTVDTARYKVMLSNDILGYIE